MAEIQKIHILPESLANKIAAGEVVERPASVIKELIENAVDAQATQITIQVEEAGLRKIQVVDNGTGMSPDDLALSISRHATSKILDADDLTRILTLGFRGEALASIAAVSRMEIKSRPKDYAAGYQINVAGGTIASKGISEGAPGTAVTVADLFFNTPARKEFLKAAAAENTAISELITRFALAHPHIAFLLINDNKRIFQTGGQDRRIDVIADIYGNQIARSMIPIYSQDQKQQLTAEGFLAPPSVTRASKKHIITFINGRWVKNKSLDEAVLSAYETLLPLHRFPICILSIHLPPHEIDVNVHPAKMEIRFHHEEAVCQFLSDSVKTHLFEQNLIPKVYAAEKSVQLKPTQSKIQFKDSKLCEEYETGFSHQPEISVQFAEIRQKYQANDDSQKYSSSEQNQEETSQGISFRIIGQLFATYILIEEHEELLIVDQHAAQERTLYEKLHTNWAQNRPAQQLLIPQSVDLTPSEKEAASTEKEILQGIGFEFDAASGSSVFLRAIPHGLRVDGAPDLFRTVLQTTDSLERKPYDQEKREEIIKSACRASVKANDYLTAAEIRALYLQLLSSENPYTCPHGRPTMLRFTKSDLEKIFKRV